MKPEGTEDFILLEQIIVTEEFLNSCPSLEKTQQVFDHLKRTGCLDQPITINRDTKILTDGYRRYIAAEKGALNSVPIVYEK